MKTKINKGASIILVNKKNDRPLYEQIKQVFFDSFGKDVLFCNYKKLAKELREVCKKYKY